MYFLYFRLVQGSQTDLSDQENKELRRREEALSRRLCSSCAAPFSLLTNRRLLCGSCLLGVCRSCASWLPALQAWCCVRCSQLRSVLQ